MNKTTKDLKLPTTITGSLPRPEWYTENLQARVRFVTRSPMHAIASSTGRGQHLHSGPGASRARLVTDGDAASISDVGGISWLLYPAAVSTASKAATTRARRIRRREGHIIFEAMEWRVMPRCTGRSGAGGFSTRSSGASRRS